MANCGCKEINTYECATKCNDDIPVVNLGALPATPWDDVSMLIGLDSDRNPVVLEKPDISGGGVDLTPEEKEKIDALRIDGAGDNALYDDGIYKPAYTSEQVDNKLSVIQTDISGLSSGLNASIIDISAIESLIPDTASPTNKLADRDFVNSTMNSIAAWKLYKNNIQGDFSTAADIQSFASAETDTNLVFYRADKQLHHSTPNDYAVVLSDETAPSPYTGQTTRWKNFLQSDGVSTVWGYELPMGIAFTASQNAAINSGITSGMVDGLSVKTAVISGEAVFSYDGAVQFISAVKGSSAASVTFRIDGDTYDETSIAGVTLPAAKYMLVNAYPAVAGVPYGSVTVKFKTI